MKKYVLTWQRDVRMDCTVFIEAKNKEDALKIWEEGDYSLENYDESESHELSYDSPKIEEEG